MGTQLTVENIKYQAWTAMVQQQVKSEMSIADWCKENGISTKTFYYRRKRIRENILQNAGPVFTELTMPKPGTNKPLASSDFTPCLTISVNGMIISVDQSTPKTLLADVLEVVHHA